MPTLFPDLLRSVITDVMLVLLLSTMGSPEPTTTINPFSDVRKDGYYYKAVLWAVEKGITVGTSSATFSPDMDG